MRRTIVALMLGVLLASTAAVGQQKTAAPQNSDQLTAYLAKLQSQPPPQAKPDKKLAKARRAAVAALASGRCRVPFCVVERDYLGNVRQGFTPKQLEWYEGKLQKKYRDICYAAPDPRIRLVFFVSVKAATYHGTRVVTNDDTEQDPVSATVTDDDGDTADIDGTVTETTETSTAVPYSFPYGIFTLTMMEPSKTPTWTGAGKNIRVLRTFQQRGIYHILYGFTYGKGKHPTRTLVQEAVKWIARGGLSTPLQTYLPPSP